jgi:superfamily I DNA/RNA helicase
MSLHKSKGLAAKLVVIAGCVEGWIPTVSETLTGEERKRALEEQRRLFYVAITRTRENLIMSSFRSIATNVAHKERVRFSRSRGGRAQTIASQFIAELGPAAPMPKAGTA